MANLLSRLWNRKAAAQSSAAFDPMNHELVRRILGGDISTSGKSVNPDSAMTLSTVWSCQRILSETIGALPVGVYQKDERGNSNRLPDHRLSLVLCNSPNANMTKVEFIESLVLNLCQTGNAYSLVERNKRGELESVVPIPSPLVTPKMDKNHRVSYSINVNGVPKDFPQSNIWHVKGFGPSGLVGLSPIQAARNAMGMALSTEDFGATFFRQGGKPSGTVHIPNFLNKEQREIARENLQQMLGGAGNAHKFALFEGGMKPEPWGNMPLQDMEFLLLRKFNVQEICRFYRVPPHMVADLDKATFSNIEQQSQEFVQYTLMPYFTRIEASVAKWLLSVEDRTKGVYLRFNFEGLLRADSAARSAFYSTALQNGWMTRNEVRAKENMNSDPALDGYTVQANMMDIEALPDEPPAAPASRLGTTTPLSNEASNEPASA